MSTPPRRLGPNVRQYGEKLRRTAGNADRFCGPVEPKLAFVVRIGGVSNLNKAPINTLRIMGHTSLGALQLEVSKWTRLHGFWVNVPSSSWRISFMRSRLLETLLGTKETPVALVLKRQDILSREDGGFQTCPLRTSIFPIPLEI
ncbi:hypothetical protein A6R68_22903 [Neotoma lepida]|uniref:Uncharacterized protein n=1 Tax=Neotoma lepida TaxID=56216 RepID=A0A1A6HYN1_NEOLE|nr:hypothetical protein A6R68_22903 [Neotoma lepida]